MRVVFMGTPEFAVPSLKALIDADYCDVAGVFTQPDKPKGRGYHLAPPPVKECALEYGIDVYQPVTLKDDEAYQCLKKLAPDVIVVVAYGKLLPENVLNLPKYGCINVHASLLPSYRGAGPIQWAVLNGDKKTGVTIMKMDKGLDTGDMYCTAETEIYENETAGQLHDRLSVIGAELLKNSLQRIISGEIKAVAQPDDFTYAPMLTKSLCPVDWNKSAFEIHNQIRGLSPWPVATALLDSKRVKLFSSKIGDKKSGVPGEIVGLTPFEVCCGDGTTVIIEQLQLEGSKRMQSDDFIRGRRIERGTILK